jgi:hypothetical protein
LKLASSIACPFVCFQIHHQFFSSPRSSFRRSLRKCLARSKACSLFQVGGLGDVVTGLARACIARGHRVEVLLPFYECIDTNQVADLQPGEEYNSFHRGGWVNLQVFRGVVSGVPVLFFKPANHFFKGSRIYGGSYDELEAYLFFSRAVLEYFQVGAARNSLGILLARESCLMGKMQSREAQQRKKDVLRFSEVDESTNT